MFLRISELRASRSAISAKNRAGVMSQWVERRRPLLLPLPARNQQMNDGPYPNKDRRHDDRRGERVDLGDVRPQHHVDGEAQEEDDSRYVWRSHFS